MRRQPAPGALTGKIVSHYRVLDIIGGGGMGVVDRAEDLKLGRRVALKFLPEELGSDPQALERFSREARAVSSLDHPNICHIYEFGEHQGCPFIVMQLLQGHTLRDRLADATEGNALSLGELLDFGIQVSDGLQAAHNKGIIHRDIKPANIFITDNRVAKILDFGVAKVQLSEPQSVVAAAAGDAGSKNCSVIPSDESAEADEESKSPCNVGDSSAIGDPEPRSRWLATSADQTTLTRTGMKLGTAGYMSPEQVRGESLDGRTDVFSFGLVLYEMATGKRAFSGETATVINDDIFNRVPVAIRELNPDLPPGLETIIKKALEKDREHRYQSAAQMREALEALLAQKKPVQSPRRIWKWPGVASLVIVVVVTWLATSKLSRRGETARHPSLSVEQLTSDGNITGGATISPSGNYIAMRVSLMESRAFGSARLSREPSCESPNPWMRRKRLSRSRQMSPTCISFKMELFSARLHWGAPRAN